MADDSLESLIERNRFAVGQRRKTWVSLGLVVRFTNNVVVGQFLHPTQQKLLGRVDNSWAVLRSAVTGGVDRQMVGRRPGQPGLDPPYGPILAYLLSTQPSICSADSRGSGRFGGVVKSRSDPCTRA